MSRQKTPYKGPKITVLGSGHSKENSTLHYGIESSGGKVDMFLDFAVGLRYPEYIPKKVPFYVVISHLHPDHINWGNLFQSVVGVDSYHPILIAPKGIHEYFEHALLSYRYTGKYHTDFEVWEISSPLDLVRCRQSCPDKSENIVKYVYKQESKNYQFEMVKREEIQLEHITEETFSPLRIFFRNGLNGIELQQTFGEHSLSVLESAVVNVSVSSDGLSAYLDKKQMTNNPNLFKEIKKIFKENFPHSKSEARDLERTINDYLKKKLSLAGSKESVENKERPKKKEKKFVEVYFSKASYLTDTLITADLLPRLGALVKDSNIIFAGVNKLLPEVQERAKHFSLEDLVSLVNLSFAHNERPIVLLMHSPQKLLGKRGLLNLARYALGPEYAKNDNLKIIDNYITSLRNIGYDLNIAFPGLQVRLPMSKGEHIKFVNKKDSPFELP